MSTEKKQLNPFELKSAILNLLSQLNNVADVEKCFDKIEALCAQENKTVLSKLLFKELSNSPKEKIPVISFLLEHCLPKEELISGLWEILKNKNLQTDVRIMVLNLLRELDSEWSYEDCSDYIEDAQEILDASTKELLNTAIINPEVQIDFMDFLQSIKTDDKITLLHTFEQDFEDDAFANILIPVFESKPNSPEGKEALKLLEKTKSQLALHTLEKMIKLTTGELNQNIRRALATLKMSGMRTDNTKEFYKKILADTTPDKFYLTYPDGRGNVAMICTRKTSQNRIRFISIVINIDNGIKDCFGFFDISQFECDKILERFLKDEKVASVSPETFVNILYYAENLTVKKSEWELPYEYVCWTNLLSDIECKEEPIEQILKEQILPAKIDSSIFERLENMKVSVHWFMDKDYNSEFENLIKNLNKDLDTVVKEFYPVIFTQEEIQYWKNKLIFSAYIKYVIGKDNEASEIYGLLFNEELFGRFLENILKRSIYEYFMLIKYNKEINTQMFTSETISDKIKYIEENWVQN